MCVCVCVCAGVGVSVFASICVHTSMYTYMYVCMYIHVYIYIYIYIYTYCFFFNISQGRIGLCHLLRAYWALYVSRIATVTQGTTYGTSSGVWEGESREETGGHTRWFYSMVHMGCGARSRLAGQCNCAVLINAWAKRSDIYMCTGIRVGEFPRST